MAQGLGRAGFDRARNARMAADALAGRAASTSTIRNSVFDYLSPMAGPTTAGTVAGLADFVPLLGDAAGFEDAADAYGEGRYGAAAVDGLASMAGLVPGLGDAAAVGLKGLGGAALGIFAGPMARTADLVALETAQKMAREGASKDDIWRETGWFTGADGKWRFEIDDSGAEVLPESVAPRQERIALAQVLDHDPLFDAYSDLAGVEAIIGNTPGRTGEYFSPEFGSELISASGPENDGLREVLLHEVQHSTQIREEFSPGASPVRGWSAEDVDRAAKEAYLEQNADAEILRELGIETSDVDIKDWETLPIRERVKWYDAGREKLYHRAAGEVEARNVQARRNMTPAERRATPPWATQDVPDDRQIIRGLADYIAATGG
jgi:hypothetical protein